VNKLLGKYNRKSFVSTGKALPTVDESKESGTTEDAGTVPTSHSGDTNHHPFANNHPPPQLSLAPPPSSQVQATSPPSYDNIQSHSIPGSLDDFLQDHAQIVEDHPDIPSPMNSKHDDDTQVHFHRRDLMVSNKSMIMREPSDAHEASKTHHYSRLGAAFVNEGSLNSLMGRGRGGRFGGRSGRGFASTA